MEVRVQIVRFVMEHQPPIVEATLLDSRGQSHTFVEKSAIFTDDWSLTEASVYPQPGAIRCEALAQWRDASGAELVRVTTERPDGIESREGSPSSSCRAVRFRPTECRFGGLNERYREWLLKNSFAPKSQKQNCVRMRYKRSSRT